MNCDVAVDQALRPVLGDHEEVKHPKARRDCDSPSHTEQESTSKSNQTI
jgi:hypothetical protein